MDPLVHREGSPGADAQGVAWPEMDQGEAQLSFLEQQLVAAAAGVRPRLRTMKYNSPVLDLRGLHPESEREGG